MLHPSKPLLKYLAPPKTMLLLQDTGDLMELPLFIYLQIKKLLYPGERAYVSPPHLLIAVAHNSFFK